MEKKYHLLWELQKKKVLPQQNADIFSIAWGGKYSYDMALNMQLDTVASIAERHTNDMYQNNLVILVMLYAKKNVCVCVAVFLFFSSDIS